MSIRYNYVRKIIKHGALKNKENNKVLDLSNFSGENFESNFLKSENHERARSENNNKVYLKFLKINPEGTVGLPGQK